MLAPTLPRVQYELWLYSHQSKFHAPATECGLFAHAAEAERVGSLLRTWLGQSVWSEGLLASAPEPIYDRVALLTLPALLRDMGVDPAYVQVTYRVFGANHDNDGPQYRTDAGHGPRGPVGESVDVKARRW